MGYRIKIKAIPPQGKAEKFAFELPEGVRFQISGKTPGMRIFAQFFSIPETILCEMVVDDGQLVLFAPPKALAGGPPPPTALLNGNVFEEEKVKPNDVAHVGNGRIEFIEVPHKQEEAVADTGEARTRFVSFNDNPEAPAAAANPATTPPAAKEPPKAPSAEDLVGIHAASKALDPSEINPPSALDPDAEEPVKEDTVMAKAVTETPAQIPVTPVKDASAPYVDDQNDSATAMIMRLNAQDTGLKPATEAKKTPAAAVKPAAVAARKSLPERPKELEPAESSTRIVNFNEPDDQAKAVKRTPTPAEPVQTPVESPERAESPTEMIMRMSVTDKKTSKKTKEAAKEVVENATRQISLGAEGEAPAEGATGMIMNMKVPNALPSSVKKGAAGVSSEKKIGASKNTDLFMRIRNLLAEDGVLPPFVSKPIRKLYNPILNLTEALRSHPAYPRCESILLSWITIGILGEVFSQVAFGSKFEFNPIPSPYNALIAIAACSLLSGLMRVLNPGEEGENHFERYLRSFAWFSFVLVPFGLSFYFPKSVIILAFGLMAATWMFYFGRKFFFDSEYFFQYSFLSWAGIIVFSLRVVGQMQFQAPIHAPVATEVAKENKEVAAAPNSTTTNVVANPAVNPAVVNPAVNPAANPVGNTAQTTAVIPTQMVGTLANQTPPAAVQSVPTKEQIAKEANSLALDPMAAEQFFNAVKSGNLSTVKTLVENHVVDPTFMLEHGSSALHFAAAQGDLSMVKYLISKKVSIDAKDAGGTTPLMWAVYHKHTNVVDYLLLKKADPNIRREGGDRAIEIAKRTRDDELIDLIQDAMKAADKTPKRSLASTPKATKKAKPRRRAVSNDE